VQNFAPLKTPLKAPLNILVIVLLRKFSKELSKEHSKEQKCCTRIGAQGPDYDANFWSFKKSFENSFEYFSNSFVKEV